MNHKEMDGTQKSFLIDVDGMKCGGCVRSVEKILLEQKNVVNASVNLVARTAYLDLKQDSENLDEILIALAARGFPSKIRVNTLIKENGSTSQVESNNWIKRWRKLIISLILLIISILGHLAESEAIDFPIIGDLSFHAGLATFAVLGPGLSILRNGAKSAIALAPSMDTLVGLGVSSAYIASLIALFWPEVGWPCFFNEPVMLLGFVLMGRFLEERARLRTGKALQQLAELQPDKARLLVNKNQIKEVRVGSLRPGDQIQLLAGDRIPIDGIVLEGYSAVDISSLTGEPLPLGAKPGVELSSGSLNLESDLIIKVQKVGAETALARIIGLVEQAQARKAPIQSLADEVAGFFCYGVIALSITTFVFWWQIGTKLWPEVLNVSGQGFFNHQHHTLHSPLGSGAETPLGLALQLAIAVLVIACPCALGLATPTVITVASGQAAKKGWLFRGGDVIEMMASLKEIVFDKTGTLTIGRPLVVDVMTPSDPDRMLRLAACLERNSRHPLANAIIDEAERRNLSLEKPSSTKTFPGEGIAGEIIGTAGTIRVGKPEWLKAEGILWNEEIQRYFEQAKATGQSIIGIAESKEFLGFLIIDDQLRPGIDIALDQLRNQGMNLAMLSGDRREAVQKIGDSLGFKAKELGWQLMPSEKLNELERLKKKGKVAMVGDGINDAPALAAADIGIAIGTGTQIAQDSADLILLGERIEGLPKALILAKKTMNKIRQNLFWAFGYNIIALPIAAGVLLPQFNLLLSPPIAALLMAISSITVVINALSLKAV